VNVIGVTSAGSVIVEMHAKQVRVLKETAARLGEMAAEIPDIVCGEDGRVQVELLLKPDQQATAPENRPVAVPAPTRPKPARTTHGARRCIGCGKEFAPVRKDQTCCSKVCRKKHEYQMRKPAAAAQGTCPICGAAFDKSGPGGYKKTTCGNPECLAKRRAQERLRMAISDQPKPPAAPPANPEAGLPPKISRLDLIRQAHLRVEGGAL
jgi:hypothetical protein